MKNAKKILALILTAAMLLSFAPVIYAANSFSDVTADNKYAEAITSLTSLDLLAGYTDGTFKPDNTITRSEFSAIITRVLGMADFVSDTDLSYVFSDMKNADGTNHWSSGCVKFAYDKGIISGMGDGTFAPDEPVTYEQAIKMVVCALNYSEDAVVSAGGWPTGYLKIASDIGLTKNATIMPTSSPASRGLVAQIIYNSLETEMCDETTGEANSGKTFLKDKLKVYEFKNMMITDVDGETTINSSKADIKKGEVLLESGSKKLTVFYGNVITAAELRKSLGYYVSGYYKEDTEDNENHLVSLNTKASKNIEINVASDNIEDFENMKLEYYAKDGDTKTSKAEISSDAILIYNGIVYDYKDSSDANEKDLSKWFNPDGDDFIYGNIRLLDSDGDKKYDAIFVEDFDVYVVKSAVKTTDTIASNNYVVYDYYNSGKSVWLDPTDDTITIDITNSKTNAAVKVESLKAMNILSVAKSADGTKYNCYVSSDTVVGSISQASASQHIYTINNKDYEITPEFTKVIDSGKETLEIGKKGTFYLDSLGRIAAVKLTAEQTGTYGYITIGALTGTSSDEVTVKLMSLTGTPSVPTKTKLADKVKINSKSYSDPDSALSALERSAALIEANQSADVTKADCSQLVKYIKNSKGEISSITTVQADKDGNIKIGSNTDTSVVQMGVAAKTLKYSGSGNFGNAVFANASTRVIVVPNNRSDDEDYKRYTGYSTFRASYSYDVEAYDINASGVASVLVVYGADTSTPITSDTKACIINSINSKLNDKTDEVAYSIEVYEEGSLKTYMTADDSEKYSELQIGDIVRFGFNGDGHINDVKTEADRSDFKYESKHDSTMYNGDYKFKTIAGTVESKSDEVIMIAPAKVEYTPEGTDDDGNPTEAAYTLDASKKEGYTKTSSTKIYRVVVKGDNTTVEAATWDSITSFADVENKTASVAFAQAYANNLKMVVVYIFEQ